MTRHITWLPSFMVHHFFPPNFTALTVLTDYRWWFANGTLVDVVFENYVHGCVSLVVGRNESCSDIDVYQYNRVETEGMYGWFLYTCCLFCLNKMYLINVR